MSTNEVSQKSFRARLAHMTAPPVFEEDEDKTRIARMVNVVLWVFWGALFPFIPVVWFLAPHNRVAIVPLVTCVLAVSFAIILNRRGKVRAAAVVFLIIIFAAAVYGGYLAGGVTNGQFYTCLLVVICAGVFLGRGGAYVFIGLTTLVGAGLIYLHDNNLLPEPTMGQGQIPMLGGQIVLALVMSGLVRMSNRGIREALERARSSQAALRERTRELEASQRVTLAASERVSPDALLDLVVDLIRDQFDLYHVQVYFIDEEEQAAVLRKSTGYAGRQLLQMEHKIPLGATALVTRAIRSGEPVLVEDVSQSPDFMSNPLLPETRSELVVPLKLGERIVGVLDAQDRLPGRFGESTVGLFQSLADQVAILFENSELIERITEQTEQMGAFTNQLRTAADIARRLSAILDPEKLGREVVELLQSRFGLYHVHIYLLDEETRKLEMEVGTGEVGRVLRERGHSIDLATRQSLVARAARSRQSVLVPDTAREPDFMPNPLLPDTRSEVAVPLVIGDQVLGVLDLQDDQPDRFTQADRDTFGTLAGQIAVALQNAALFEQIRETTQTPTAA